ncbi:NADP-dependent oxidoreductase [Cryptosporangium phraense]|uniref:NADP-dependent oxidoreductase n=1 Tax=Cryptosporangium phraense TaxID=2593070 RepID=A0A545AM05_9ACTN|nr:NADP-dependent oxidoreductase [Cryptosporangium phraense]TQS42357.1 NADP-dependent oxidoreductase [Cryptosporangium phraense]
MKALQFAGYGEPNVLVVADVPEPHAGPGEIRIAVRAAGVSPGDAAIRSGAWRDRVPLTLPYVVGLDAAGVVDEVGDGVDDVRVGDPVFGLRFRGGTTAEHALLDAWAPKPAGMTWEQAGGAAGSIETAVRALDALGIEAGRRAPIDGADGRTVLIDGAAGGVGAIAVQIAVARGARVIGTASPANHAFLAGLGAIPIEYGPGLPDRVELPIDAALDVAGHGSIAELVRLTGDPDAVLTLIDPRAGEHGVRLSRFDPTADLRGALRYGAGLVDVGRLVAHLADVYRMTEGAAAHARVATGHARGKVVLTVP